MRKAATLDRVSIRVSVYSLMGLLLYISTYKEYGKTVPHNRNVFQKSQVHPTSGFSTRRGHVTATAEPLEKRIKVPDTRTR